MNKGISVRKIAQVTNIQGKNKAITKVKSLKGLLLNSLKITINALDFLLKNTVNLILFKRIQSPVIKNGVKNSLKFAYLLMKNPTRNIPANTKI